MWIGLLTLLPLMCSSVFRKMVTVLPLTIGTTIASSYRKALIVVRISNNVLNATHWALSQIWSGNSQIIKDLVLLGARSWLSKKLRTGDLKAYKRRYVLTYYEGDRRFQVCFPKTRGPKKIVSVETQGGSVITTKFFEAMGPSNNFYGIPTTPQLLGYSGSLKIKYRSGVIVHYLSDEIIKISA